MQTKFNSCIVYFDCFILNYNILKFINSIKNYRNIFIVFYYIIKLIGIFNLLKIKYINNKVLKI